MRIKEPRAPHKKNIGAEYTDATTPSQTPHTKELRKWDSTVATDSRTIAQRVFDKLTGRD